MATINLHSAPAPATKTFRERMLDHDVNGVRDLIDCRSDAAITLTRHIHALALMLESAHNRMDDGQANPATDNLNPEIIAGCMGAIARLAAEANFFACEAASRLGEDK